MSNLSPHPSLVVFLLCCLLLPAQGECKRLYNTAAKRDPNKLNVHIICHTHDDGGWLKTFDQYYYGTRQDIQLANVKLILDSVVEALKDNPDRKFNYGEMSFFSKWWGEQPESVRTLVKELVAKGQLDFMNGGYVQHDEAATHYVGMIDQTTRGHRFLNSTFGKRVRVGWQIDPFGHSGTQASLLSALLGFEALVIGRADYQDMAARKRAHGMEMVWRGATSWGSSAQVWTHQNYDGNYSPFPGFNFDYGQQEAPIVDNEESAEYNLRFKINWFVNLSRTFGAYTRGNDIIYTAGTDFTYTNAPYWYTNLDKLIHYANLDGRVNVFYSTVSEFIDAKKSYSNITWPVRTEDFFPYADSYHAWWTGYFTSRPTSKASIRAASAFLQAARQLHVAVHSVGADEALDELEAAVSLCQHHDSITGTEKQHVANNYHWLLFKAWQKAQGVVNKALLTLIFDGEEGSAVQDRLKDAPMLHKLPRHQLPDPTQQAQRQHTHQHAAAADSGDAAPLPTPPAITLDHCLLINSSVCAPSVVSTTAGNGLLVVLYNSLAWPRVSNIRVPVEAGQYTFRVEDSNGVTQKSQLIPISNSTKRLQQTLLRTRQVKDAASFASQDIAFQAELPPLGYATYYIRPSGPSTGPARAVDLDSQTVDQVKAGTSDLEGDQAAGHITGVGEHAGVQLMESALVAESALGRDVLQPSDEFSHLLNQGEAVMKSAGLDLEQASQNGGWNMAAAATQLPNAPSPAGPQIPQRFVTVSDAELEAIKKLPTPTYEHKKLHIQSRASALKAEDITISNSKLSVAYDADTGFLKSIAAADSSWTFEVTQQFLWYHSSDGKEKERPGQASGAYIFRPMHDNSTAQPITEKCNITVVTGPVVTEVRQEFASWVSLTTRLWAEAEHLEMEWTVGSIPMADGIGKEIVSRFVTNLKTDGTLWHDSNGREMTRRVRDKRQSWNLTVTDPIQGNFYPMTTGSFISDGQTTLALVTERGQGVASLSDGELEVMVHRAMAVDDWRGVDEPLNETMCGVKNSKCPGLIARGIHYVLVKPASQAARAYRPLQLLATSPAVLSLSGMPSPTVGGRGEAWRVQQGRRSLMSKALMTEGLPPNVELVTLMRTGPKQLLLRLGHVYQVDEDADLAVSVQLDVTKVLAQRVVKVTELNLSGAQCKKDLPSPFTWPLDDTPAASERPPFDINKHADSPPVFELHPMEIRTFEVIVE